MSMYYKVIFENMIIDILSNPRWVLWLKRSGRFIMSDITTANGVISSNGLEVYNIKNKGIFENNEDIHKSVDVVEIPENEYNNLNAKLTGKVLNANGDIIGIQSAREDKIAEMKQKCEESIIYGFDIVLSDGISHHYSLEITDQLKITKLNDRANAGVDFLPYHADGELCKIYSKEDINAINAAMERVVEYHTTYFNSLKVYINNINNVQSVINIKYGVEIPDEYQSDVMKLLNQTLTAENEVDDEGVDVNEQTE